MDPGAKLGFHSGAFPGATASELQIENEKDRQALLAAGVPAWFADRAYSTPSDSMWWPTIDELKQANVINAVAAPDDFAISGPGILEQTTPEAVDDALLKIPIYAAIKKFEPSAYAEIRRTFVDGVRLGRSQAEVIGQTRDMVSQITQKYMAVSSDQAIVEEVKVLVAELDELRAVDADACFYFLYPQAGVSHVDLSRVLSSELREREMAALGAVVESGAATPQRIPSESEVAGAMNKATKALALIHSSSELAQLSEPTKGNHATVCTVAADLYRQILMLPVRDQGPLLRFLSK
jgi:hypothetical protein